MTCAHRGSTDSAPSRGALQDRHSAGGGASSSRRDPDPVSGPCPDGRAGRPSCGPCCAPARTAAGPAWPPSPRYDPSTKASRSRCCPSPAAAPAQPAAAQAASAAPARRPAQPAAARSPRPSPPPRPAARRSQHEAPMRHQATAHRPRAAGFRTRRRQANRQTPKPALPRPPAKAQGNHDQHAGIQRRCRPCAAVLPAGCLEWGFCGAGKLSFSSVIPLGLALGPAGGARVRHGRRERLARFGAHAREIPISAATCAIGRVLDRPASRLRLK